MSARAIQAMREKKGGVDQLPVVEDDESEEEEPEKPAATAFAGMLDSSSDEEESEEEGSDEDGSEKKEVVVKMEEQPQETIEESDEKVAEQKPDEPIEAEPTEAEPDLDELLQEFQEMDDQKMAAQGPDEPPEISSNAASPILLGLDPRDLDYDLSMRTSLMGGTASLPTPSKRKQKQNFFFGPPRDGWIRPPHYVGGGMGMTTYDRDPRPLPWPYNDPTFLEEACPPCSTTLDRQWATFQFSDSYLRDYEDYQRVKQTGDLNTLVMFVAHHPYVADALLQLSTILYQTNRSAEGLALLRRCLWVYECSSLLSFMRELDATVRMDYEQRENETYMDALFRLVQVSYIAGLTRTSLAASRLLLSLDPLRDPKGVLLALDHFVLMSDSLENEQWLIQLVEEKAVKLVYRDEQSMATNAGELTDLPNWAFSYALALFRQLEVAPSDEAKEKADQAIQEAISQFPLVVGLLLEQAEVDTTGRSCRRDWNTVLEFASERANRLKNEWISSSTYDPATVSATLQTCERIIGIFAKQNTKLWCDNDKVLQWVHDNMILLSSNPAPKNPPSPALMRYSDCNPADYENKIQLLPLDENLFNPGLLDHAMAINPNRPRLLQGQQQRGAIADFLHQDDEGLEELMRRAGVDQAFFGPPRHNVDPE